MLISKAFWISLCVGAGLLAGILPGSAFDGTASDVTPVEAFKTGTKAYFAGDKKTALDALSFAAENGHPLAQWKLGRMYQNGDGVPEDDLKAYEYFRSIADAHADESPNSPEAPFVASAFVALGSYYVTGINDTAVKPNLDRAREIFSFAASYFGDAEAQYNLGRMYLEGSGGDRNPRQAARWLHAAAKKGHHRAQALLGKMLVEGEDMKARTVAGLKWLIVARTCSDATKDQWINESLEQSFALADEKQRRKAANLAERWMATTVGCY
ncbi:MAG: exopolysaccharide biosynthesis protein [Hyphomicrobiales bacterium]|nr:MAG: exopolysaccharide biosynthesis protein [Hyphomicrobiales bacterium]